MNTLSSVSKQSRARPHVKGNTSFHCPICKATIPASRLKLPPGEPSCLKCGARLQRPSGENQELEVVAQVVPQSENIRVDYDQSFREHQLISALQREPRTALQGKSRPVSALFLDGARTRVKSLGVGKSHRFTIRQSSHWAGILSNVNVQIAPATWGLRIAEILCAAKLWNENQLGITKRSKRQNHHFKAPSPFDASYVRKLYRKDQQYHRQFERRGRRMLAELETFTRYLKSHPNQIDSIGYAKCLGCCRLLSDCIRERLERKPSLHGTSLQDPTKPRPDTWAGAAIFRSLKRHWKKEASLAYAVTLLAIVFPEYRTTQTDPLMAAIWQAHLRASRVRP